MWESHQVLALSQANDDELTQSHIELRPGFTRAFQFTLLYSAHSLCFWIVIQLLQADDEALMKTIHLANVACGFHAGDFETINTTVALAKKYGVRVGAHPSLPDRQGFGRREMLIKPEELKACFVYQIGAITGFLKMQNLELNHVKPHGSIYGQTARSLPLAQAVVAATKTFSTDQYPVAFIGLPGTMHQVACKEAGIKFIPEWFADLDYDSEGRLLITKNHDPVSLDTVRERVRTSTIIGIHREITTNKGTFLPLSEEGLEEVTICCHSDTPGAVKIAELVKCIVDQHNEKK
ncbi:Lactam utilization protein lamB [Mycena indigotica]|uniref:Lactam utilization protein lamB n=1 Tax=Mycena indigotica TaxID=2126181 RepID=A0A8H6TCW4_9AGAR|nr:Lactam utilization protein lamB [Mycena indigotica]KAF7315126.1 Lactam utilization protein lamB [Mycena indigotica]